MNGMPRWPTIDETTIEVTASLPAEDRQRGAGGVVRAEVVDVHQLAHLRRRDRRRSRRRCRSRRCTIIDVEPAEARIGVDELACRAVVTSPTTGSACRRRRRSRRT